MNLLELVLLCGLFNVMTFGNGPAMIPLLQAALVDGRHVLTADQLLYAFAIARVTPGQANVYVASIGYMLYGVAGALLSTLAIVLPGYLMLPIMRGYRRWQSNRAVQGATKGLAAASAGLIVAATLDLGWRSLTSPAALAVFGLALVSIVILKWNTFLTLALSGAAGLLLYLWAG